MGRPGRIKSKGSEASTSQDGDKTETPKSNRTGKRQGRPRKSQAPDDSVDSPLGSRESTPYSPAVSRLKRKAGPQEAILASSISDFDPDQDCRSHRLARFLAENPDSKEEYLKLIGDRTSYPPWINEKEMIEYEGTVFASGDIVSLLDEEGDLPYFAQIRSLIYDQFMRPFAWITWLAPRESAKSANLFDPDHFSHALVDHKLYELECVHWESERPQQAAYQPHNPHQVMIDKLRVEELNERRMELFRAAGLETASGPEVIRVGDVKRIHAKEREGELEELIEKARERGIARKAEQARRREEMERRREEEEEESDSEKEEEEDEEEEEGEGEGEEREEKVEVEERSARVRIRNRVPSVEESDEDEDEEEEEEEKSSESVEKREESSTRTSRERSSSVRGESKRGRGGGRGRGRRGRTGSQTSTTSKETDGVSESADSEKPMEED